VTEKDEGYHPFLAFSDGETVKSLPKPILIDAKGLYLYVDTNKNLPKGLFLGLFESTLTLLKTQLHQKLP